MTIGANMPFRSRLDILVRDTGKEAAPGNPKEMPVGKETLGDFKLLLKAVGSKQQSQKNPAPDDEVLDRNERSDPEKNDNATPQMHGIFAPPPITALEQMLERQQHTESSKFILGGTEDADTGLVAEARAEPTIDVAEHEGPNVSPEVARSDKLKALEIRVAPPQIAAAPALPEPQPSQAAPASRPADFPPDSAGLVEPELVKSDAGIAAEPPVVADRNASSPTTLPQPETRPSALPATVVTAPVNRPPLADIQIVSDRTNGAARTLVIQLQPVELGTVTARLRLTSDGMHIQITAENAAMAEHLTKDHEALGKALHRAGVADDASTVTISIVDRSAAAANPQTGQQNFNGQEPQAGARPNGQGQSGFQGTPGERTPSEHRFGEIGPDDQLEKPATSDPQGNLSRGLVV